VALRAEARQNGPMLHPPCNIDFIPTLLPTIPCRVLVWQHNPPLRGVIFIVQQRVLQQETILLCQGKQNRFVQVSKSPGRRPKRHACRGLAKDPSARLHYGQMGNKDDGI